MKQIQRTLCSLVLFSIASVLIVSAQEHHRAAAEKIISGPRVESVSDHTATIAWTTDVGGSSVILYGTHANDLPGRAESPYARTGETHRVELKNLRRDTTYYYRVDSGQGEGTGSSAESGLQQFRTK